MHTKEQLITALVQTQVADAMRRDQEAQKGYGSRIAKAGDLVLAQGVKALGNSEYEVQSGSTPGLTYIVNGACHCQDAEKGLKKLKNGAPAGFCKHRMAVVIHKKVQEHLKDLAELRIPHPHRWDCAAHRDLELTCWQRVCPDALEMVCPTCAAEAPNLAELVTLTDDEEARIEAQTAHPDDDESDHDESPYTENPDEESPTMMTSISQTIKKVVSGFATVHRSGCANVPPHIERIIAEEGVPTKTYIVEPEPTPESPVMWSVPCGGDDHQDAEPPLPPLQYTVPTYEPAPVLVPKPGVLPEAGASLNIKVRVDNFELMYTMRGHTDPDVLERLPQVLATLERLMKTEVDHDESFMKRLLHTFFPKPSRYTGK